MSSTQSDFRHRVGEAGEVLNEMNGRTSTVEAHLVTQTHEPVRLFRENPRYVEFRGQPTILIGSSEHYSSLLNRAFDYRNYLHTIAECGLNHTRVYSGIKRETPGLFNIGGNSQAPTLEEYLAPWQRSGTAGANDGGNKFDLTRWDDDYFERFHDFFQTAGEVGVEIEFVLFSAFHIKFTGPGLWQICPMNVDNNVNGVGDIDGLDFCTLKDSTVLEFQKNMIEKLVTEANGYDNVHFETCNEPYNDDIPDEWLQFVAHTVQSTEAKLSHQHLVSTTTALGYRKIAPIDGVSIYNFHYPSEGAFDDNRHLPAVLGVNETGILPRDEYALQAWETLFLGAGLYNMLDYSFTTQSPNGEFVPASDHPGGGGPVLRAHLSELRKFFDSFEFWKMSPDDDLLIDAATLNGRAYVLAQRGKQYALYYRTTVHTGMTARCSWRMSVVAGTYSIEVRNVLTGDVLAFDIVDHPGGALRHEAQTEDLAPENAEIAFAVSITRAEPGAAS